MHGAVGAVAQHSSPTFVKTNAYSISTSYLLIIHLHLRNYNAHTLLIWITSQPEVRAALVTWYLYFRANEAIYIQLR